MSCLFRFVRVACRSVCSLKSSSSALCFPRSFSSSPSPSPPPPSDVNSELKRTVLYDEHVSLGGKMVPFAGYALPVQYRDSLINSHLHCRQAASVFDVSHMGQLRSNSTKQHSSRIWGNKRVDFIESLVPGDIAGLSPNQARLSCLTNTHGGIIDDCMITSKSDHLYMVVNAGCKEKDLTHMNQHLATFNKKNSSDVSIEIFSEQWELLALQGPLAAKTLAALLPASVNLSQLPFMYSANLDVAGVQCIVTRCGYTGEDGFEISIPANQTKKIFHILLDQKDVLPAGLGVRDSLRLEAGLSLYGHDLNEDITPVEASLSWLIGKRRKEQGGFLGAEVIQKQLQEGVSKKRVGLKVLAGAPAREGAEILKSTTATASTTPQSTPSTTTSTASSSSGEKIGVVTSGGFSPCLKQGIAMGYIATPQSKNGTKVAVNVRGKVNEAEVTKLPFVPAKYYKPA